MQLALYSMQHLPVVMCLVFAEGVGLLEPEVGAIEIPQQT